LSRNRVQYGCGNQAGAAGFKALPLGPDITAPLIARKEHQTMEFNLASAQCRQLGVVSEKLLCIWALLVLLASAAFLGCQSQRAASPPPSVEVEVVSVVQEDVPIYGEWVATLDGYVNAQIQPQVSGYLIKQGYKEGSFVRKGQELFEIDPRPFQAVLDQADAQLAQSQARVDTERLRHMSSQFQARGCDAIARPLLFRLTDRIRSEAESFALHSWQMV
jgi:multidrug efflux pump subunit AcrA (membrane-fusion protein)